MMKQQKNLDFKRIVVFFENMPIFWYVPIVYLILFTLQLPLEKIANLLHIPDTELVSQNIPTSPFMKYFMVVLVAPFFETYIFQAIPYHLLNTIPYVRRHVWITILVASVIFGLVHTYSIQFMIHTTIVGFFFIATFIIRAKKKDQVLCTYLLHAFSNFVAVTLSWHSKI